MDKHLFVELVGSMKQMKEIVRGKRAPSREFAVGRGELRRALTTGRRPRRQRT